MPSCQEKGPAPGPPATEPEESSPAGQVEVLVEHLFRQESSRLVALLTRSFGPSRLDLAEEVVQEAMLRALRRWPYHGVPHDPPGWLYAVARNCALDRIRRDASFREREGEIRQLLPSTAPAPRAGLAGDITDDQLRLIFLCCHPALPQDARVALTLKTIGGFSVAEIARAFLARESTIAQRLVRAQRRIRQLDLAFELPAPEQMAERTEAVFEGIYLMFNEGYSSRGGDRLVREDLCGEALRLVVHLTELELPAFDVSLRARAHALAALLFFQASRLASRTDGEGGLVLLADQDRRLWDRRALARAFGHLERSGVGNRVSAYHLQAQIASHHASAASAAETDWPAILELYGELARLDPSPVVLLNRAVAVGEVRGAGAALEELQGIEAEPVMAEYHWLHAVKAELLRRHGDWPAAIEAYSRALELTHSEPELRFLKERLESLP